MTGARHFLIETKDTETDSAAASEEAMGEIEDALAEEGQEENRDYARWMG